MVNPNISRSLHTLTTMECLAKLKEIVPKNEAYLSHLTDSEKSTLQGMISDLLQRVNSNEKSFVPYQRGNLKTIGKLAKRAEQLHLLSKEGKTAFHGIVSKTKEIGLSLYAAPCDAILETSEGPVRVNSEVLKKNSSVFKEMIADLDGIDMPVPVDLPKITVYFLLECLQAPEDAPINLPEDTGMLPGLLGFAAGYHFDKLIQKLEPVITRFLEQNRDALETDRDDWLKAFYLLSKTHPEVAKKWYSLSTPYLLEKFDLPVKNSLFFGQFELTIAHLNAFFNEPTCDLLKYLPLVIKVNDENELAIFQETIQKTKIAVPLPLKLAYNRHLAPDDKTNLQQVAKAFNIHLDIERWIPTGTKIFGKELWDTYLGEVEDVPLPEGITELLESEFRVERTWNSVISEVDEPTQNFPDGDQYIVDSGKKWKDEFMLVLLPKTVDGEPLTLNRFRELAQHPKGGGHAVNYGDTNPGLLEECGNKAVERSEWVLMSMEPVLIHGCVVSTELKKILELIPGCEIPDALSAHICILTHFIHTGERLYSFFTGEQQNGEPYRTYTYCKEMAQLEEPGDTTAIIGGFDADGLNFIALDYDLDENWGAGALRKFGER